MLYYSSLDDLMSSQSIGDLLLLFFVVFVLYMRLFFIVHSYFLFIFLDDNKKGNWVAYCRFSSSQEIHTKNGLFPFFLGFLYWFFLILVVGREGFFMAIWLTKKWRIIGVYKWLMGFNYWLGSQSLHWTVGLPSYRPFLSCFF